LEKLPNPENGFEGPTTLTLYLLLYYGTGLADSFFSSSIGRPYASLYRLVFLIFSLTPETLGGAKA